MRQLRCGNVNFAALFIRDFNKNLVWRRGIDLSNCRLITTWMCGRLLYLLNVKGNWNRVMLIEFTGYKSDWPWRKWLAVWFISRSGQLLSIYGDPPRDCTLSITSNSLSIAVYRDLIRIEFRLARFTPILWSSHKFNHLRRTMTFRPSSSQDVEGRRGWLCALSLLAFVLVKKLPCPLVEGKRRLKSIFAACRFDSTITRSLFSSHRRVSSFDARAGTRLIIRYALFKEVLSIWTWVDVL